MRTINLNTQQGCKVLVFPDKQPHVTLIDELDESTMVICSITDSQKLLELCMLTDALNNYQTYKVLHIPYLMGARYDRRMEVHGSFDLKVIAKVINSLNYDGVVLYDVHSDVSTALIDKAVNLDKIDTEEMMQYLLYLMLVQLRKQLIMLAGTIESPILYIV